MLVLADEVYDRILFDGASHVSIASLPGMWRRTVSVGSAGKTFSVTGWKLGWAVGAQELIKPMQLVHQNVVFLAPTLLQEALARAFRTELRALSTSGASYWHELRAKLQFSRDELARILRAANISFVLPDGGYFMLADLAPLLAGRKSSAEVKRDAMAETGSGFKSRYVEAAQLLLEARDLMAVPAQVFVTPAQFVKQVSAAQLAPSLQAARKDAFDLTSDATFRLCFIKSNATLRKLEALLSAV